MTAPHKKRTMRIRNKELRARRQRKEQRVKEIIRELKAGKGKAPKSGAAVQPAEVAAEVKTKAAAKPKAPAKPKAEKPKSEPKAETKPKTKSKKAEGE